MRTVTFSDKRVAERVNSKFIPVWYNRGPGFHNCTFWSEERIFTNDVDCYPTRNICTFFLDPDGGVVYYIAGHWGPKAFLEILDTVQALFPLTARKRSQAHAEMVTTLDARNARVRASKDVAGLLGTDTLKYGSLTHAHSANCLWTLSTALKCRREVHLQLAKPESIPLTAVQHSYLFGNSFTEEPKKKSIPTLAAPRVPVETEATPSGE